MFKPRRNKFAINYLRVVIFYNRSKTEASADEFTCEITDSTPRTKAIWLRKKTKLYGDILAIRQSIRRIKK